MIKHLLDQVEFKHLGKWLFLGMVVGVVSGAGAVLFYWLLDLSTNFFLVKGAGYVLPHPAGEGPIGRITSELIIGRRWLLLLIPVIGGLISGLLIYTYAPEAEGHGTDAVISAFHWGRGIIRPIVPIIKTIASAITIGSGGSAGREGPIAQIGAGFASVLGKLMKFSVRDRRILILSGTAGGIGSIFRAPLGGALFATEVLYRHPDFESDAVIPSIISAIFAYIVFGFTYSFKPIFSTPDYTFKAFDLLWFGILGLLLVPLGYVYVRSFYRTRDFFKQLSFIPNHLKPMIGGIGVGILIYLFPPVAETSYGWMQLAFLGKISIGMLVLLGFAKIGATSLTIGSGGSGGVFAPSLAIGAFFGAAYGNLIQILFPNLAVNPSAFAVVGMGSFFASVGKVPLSALVMVLEMTGNYDLLVPMTLSMSLAYIFSGRWSIYENQVTSKVQSPVHQGELIMDIMEEIHVKDAIQFPTKVLSFYENTNILDALRKVATVPYHCFPVIGIDGKLHGFLYSEDLRSLLFSGELDTLAPAIIVGDILSTNVPTLSPEDDLKRALSLFISSGRDELPVIDENNRCVGILTHKELMKAYDRELARRKNVNL